MQINIVNAFLGFVVGVVFACGGFYVLTNWRLNRCEDTDKEIKGDIRDIKENHLAHIQNDISEINTMIAMFDTRISGYALRVENHSSSNEKRYLTILEELRGLKNA